MPVLGRYELSGKIASGGMATVYLGRMSGPVGFCRVVAVKRMHPHLAKDPEFVAMFLDEAMLAARVQHPNVVATLDVVAESGEIFIVMDYVRGQSLAELLRASSAQDAQIPVPIAVGVLVGALAGLHAAHEARGDGGRLLGIVHRDVSPQNVLVGVDGGARLVDFGVAKATSRLQVTRENQLKGKVCYMAPEQLRPGPKNITRAADIFAAGAVLWELLAGRRLFQLDEMGETIAQIVSGHVEPLRPARNDVTAQLESVVMRALETSPEKRFPTAEAFAAALEAISPHIAGARAIGQWVTKLAPDALARREAQVVEMENSAPAPQPSMDSVIRVLGEPMWAEPRDEAICPDPPPEELAKELSTPIDASGVHVSATAAAEDEESGLSDAPTVNRANGSPARAEAPPPHAPGTDPRPVVRRRRSPAGVVALIAVAAFTAIGITGAMFVMARGVPATKPVDATTTATAPSPPVAAVEPAAAPPAAPADSEPLAAATTADPLPAEAAAPSASSRPAADERSAAPRPVPTPPSPRARTKPTARPGTSDYVPERL